jgi:hypothetical protein
MEQTRIDSDRVGSSAGRRPSAGVRATVFGLDVSSEIPFSLLEGLSASPTGRALEITTRAGDVPNLDWPESAELVCDERLPDGNSIFSIEAHPEAGYLMSGPEYGKYLLSADGRRLRCFPEDGSEDARQRLLIAQVLPFAALLRGLEVFHASAVARRGVAVAILGPSGAGKTSVALELCRLGADFLADDVLALEVRDAELLVHPGTQIAGLDHAEARRLERAGEPRREKVAAVNERERLLRMRGTAEPAPLAALFFLDRRSDGPPSPRFESVGDAQPLLSATFNFVLSTPERLRGLLEVCALAARRRVERIVAGPDVDATQLAGAVERRIDTLP